MGSFAFYDGVGPISEERRSAFVQALDKVLFFGGMMHIGDVKLHGYRLDLLKPVRVRRDEDVWFTYNYFEDTSWETAGFNAKDFYFWSNKIGDREFSSVILAAYELLDLYGEEPGIVSRDGDVVDVTALVGWVNHLTGAEFTLEHRLTHLWEIAEDHPWVAKHGPSALVPAAYARAAASLDYADLCYVAQGTGTLTEDEVEEGSYPGLVLKVKRALERYLEAAGIPDEAVSRVFDLVRRERACREELRVGDTAELAALSLEVPARVIVYLACELQGLKFWDEWEKLQDVAYHDEIMRDFVPEWLKQQRSELLARPVPAMRTSDYLRDDDSFTFWGTPKELMHVPRYYVSDDDRLFWWDGTDEVIISPKCDEWLRKLADRHQEIVVEMEASDGDADAGEADRPIKDLIALFVDLNKHYKHLFPFEDMFYEFMQNATSTPWRAGIALIREVGEEMREKGAAIKYLSGSWDTNSKQVTFNEGRVTMKRVYAVMANRQLRERYFGF